MPRQYQGPNLKTPWDESLDNVVAEAASGRLAEALALLKRLRRKDRGGLINHEWHDAEMLWLEAVVLEHVIELGRYQEAAAALQTARGLVTRDDLRAMVLTKQGELELHRGHLAEAEARFREATELEGCSDWTWIKLGQVHFQQGALDDAERCLRAAVAAGGRYPATALYELGLILRARSSLFEARRILKQAIALSSHVAVHEALADVERTIRLQSRDGRQPGPHSPGDGKVDAGNTLE